MKGLYYFAVALLFIGCQNLDDADQTERKTFIRFYEGAHSMIAADCKPTDDGGYIIAGTVEVLGDNPKNHMVVIKTSRFGEIVWQLQFENGRSRSISHIDGIGYILVGDGIEFSPNSGDIADLENTSARYIIIGEDGTFDPDHDRSFSTKEKNEQQTLEHIDFKGNAVTTDVDGNLVFLSSRRKPRGLEYATLTGISASTLDTLWYRTYEYLNRDYQNTNSIYRSSDALVWGSSITETTGNFTKSYLVVPRVAMESEFLSSEYFGQNSDQIDIQIRDFKPAASGYVATGTYSETDGSKSNIFFIRVNSQGKFDAESIRFYDSGTPGLLANSSESTLQDAGAGIAPTRDGSHVIVGSTLKGTGTDILLIKVRRSGEVIWQETIGGKSNENVQCVYETSDGGFVLCGTLQDGNSQTGGLSSIFLIKTNSRGKLNN
jgi:hypothetical protein